MFSIKERRMSYKTEQRGEVKKTLQPFIAVERDTCRLELK